MLKPLTFFILCYSFLLPVFPVGEFGQIMLKTGKAYVVRGRNTITLSKAGDKTEVFNNDIIQTGVGSSAVLTSPATEGNMQIGSASALKISPWRYVNVTGTTKIFQGSFRVENDSNNQLSPIAKKIYFESDKAIYSVYADQKDDVILFVFKGNVKLHSYTVIDLPKNHYSYYLYSDTVYEAQPFLLSQPLTLINNNSETVNQIENNDSQNLSDFAAYLRDFNVRPFQEKYSRTNIRQLLGEPEKRDFNFSIEKEKQTEKQRYYIFTHDTYRYSHIWPILDRQSVISTIKEN